MEYMSSEKSVADLPTRESGKAENQCSKSVTAQLKIQYRTILLTRINRSRMFNEI
jgi:hypothetical protein